MFPCRLTTFSGVSANLLAAVKNLCGFCSQNVTLKIHLAISRVASENSEFLIAAASYSFFHSELMWFYRWLHQGLFSVTLWKLKKNKLYLVVCGVIKNFGA